MNGNFSKIENETILQGKNSEIYLEDIPLTDKTFKLWAMVFPLFWCKAMSRVAAIDASL